MLSQRQSVYSLAVIVVLAAFLPTWSQQTKSTDGQERQDFSKVTDEQFGQMAEQINLTEIAIGNQAVSKAKRMEVRQFGKQMVSDHTAANRKLMMALNRKAEFPGKLDAKHQAKVDKMAALSSDDFDRAYIDEMVKGHQMVANLFEHESSNGNNASLKAYAAELLPSIRMHLQKAQQISREVLQNPPR